MSASLESFFAAMEPLLFGKISAAEVEQRIGPSPSGTEALDFYRVLVRRNMFKILRDVYPTVRTAALRLRPTLWTELVEALIEQHPPREHDPNAFAKTLVDVLAERRKVDESIPPWLEELADFHYLQWLAYSAHVERGDDGFDQRLFIRQYTHPVPEIVEALSKSTDGPWPPQPSPTLIIVFRQLGTEALRIMRPTVVGLAALARRRGAPLPEPLSRIPSAQIELALRGLIDAGVLWDRSVADAPIHIEDDKRCEETPR